MLFLYDLNLVNIFKTIEIVFWAEITKIKL